MKRKCWSNACSPSFKSGSGLSWRKTSEKLWKVNKKNQVAWKKYISIFGTSQAPNKK
jgi:hypothetical protein